MKIYFSCVSYKIKKKFSFQKTLFEQIIILKSRKNNINSERLRTHFVIIDIKLPNQILAGNLSIINNKK